MKVIFGNEEDTSTRERKEQAADDGGLREDESGGGGRKQNSVMPLSSLTLSVACMTGCHHAGHRPPSCVGGMSVTMKDEGG